MTFLSEYDDDPLPPLSLLVVSYGERLSSAISDDRVAIVSAVAALRGAMEGDGA